MHFSPDTESPPRREADRASSADAPAPAFSAFDHAMMTRALALAAQARGRVAPNPMVGCVIAREGRIVGEGWHDGPGLAHAEVVALAGANGKARGGEAFVTLEPCAHFGRTPPCAQALIAAGVKRVVYALSDPNPIAAGGAATLREAGVIVERGLLAEEARALNRGWLFAQERGRPLVIAKTAMSLDGHIATHAGDSKWITGPQAREAGHALRAQADAILVGAGTACADDPTLTARFGGETREPLRVVVDSGARTPPGAKLFDRSGRGGALATTPAAPKARRDAIRRIGGDVLLLPANDKGRVDLVALLDALRARGATTVMIEGGGALIGAFFDADLIDELHLFIAPILIGGGAPALGGAGLSSLSEADRYRMRREDDKGDCQHWIAERQAESGLCSRD